jgi:hypothetical protein
MFNIALATLRLGQFDKAKVLYKNYTDLCKERQIDVINGAADDLKNLIKKNIQSEQAEFILQHFFSAEN